MAQAERSAIEMDTIATIGSERIVTYAMSIP